MFVGSLDPVSNRATWTVQYELTDADTDEAVDISSVDEIKVYVRDPATKSLVLSATKTGGAVTIVDDGTFQWTFSASSMGALAPKTYEVGCTLTDNSDTVQLLIGLLPVLDGIVT